MSEKLSRMSLWPAALAMSMGSLAAMHSAAATTTPQHISSMSEEAAQVPTSNCIGEVNHWQFKDREWLTIVIRPILRHKELMDTYGSIIAGSNKGAPIVNEFVRGGTEGTLDMVLNPKNKTRQIAVAQPYVAFGGPKQYCPQEDIVIYPPGHHPAVSITRRK